MKKYTIKEYVSIDIMNMIKSHSDYEIVSCSICGEVNSKNLFRRGQFGFPCYVSICKKCGLLYLSPRWKKVRYKKFYSYEYDSFYRSVIFNEENDYNNIKYQRIVEILERISGFDILKNGKSVLDVYWLQL